MDEDHIAFSYSHVTVGVELISWLTRGVAQWQSWASWDTMWTTSEELFQGADQAQHKSGGRYSGQQHQHQYQDRHQHQVDINIIRDLDIDIVHICMRHTHQEQTSLVSTCDLALNCRHGIVIECGEKVSGRGWEAG